jgi:EAL domain-containing protein (putative c-di-GMP-specific phosphodiesterase class I)/PleD family two-component response regulator
VSAPSARKPSILCGWCGSTVREGPPGFASTADGLCPACAEELVRNENASRAGASEDSGRALIVDSDETWRAKLTELARREGLAVTAAAGESEALTALRDAAYDLILLGLPRGERDVVGACSRLRSQLSALDVPILLFQDAEDPSTIERAFEGGATDFASKSASWPLLVHRLSFLRRSWKARADLWRNQASLALVQRAANLGLWTYEPIQQEISLSWEAMRLLGAARARVPVAEFAALAGEQSATVAAAIERLLEGGFLDVEFRTGTPEAPGKFFRLRAQSVPRWAREMPLVVGTLLDVTPEREAQAEIERLARFDAATGLAQSSTFAEFVDAATADASDTSPVAVLAVSVPPLARIATTFGKAQREKTAVEVARRLKAALREMESGGGAAVERRYLLARGGDAEFLVLARNTDRTAASDLAARIVQAAQHSVVVAESHVPLSALVGIAIHPKDGLNAEALVAAAEEACDRLAPAGWEYGYYTKRLKSASVARFMTEAFLRDALATNGLRLHLQPQVLSETGGVAGAEALLRPAVNGAGIPTPAELVRVAEETGLIVPLGQWTLREATTLARAWNGFRLTLGVNFSARELPSPGFAEAIVSAAQALAPHTLELEITETSLLQEQSAALERLHRIQDAGVRIAIDDFGTGYSTLRQLAELPVDTVKIDASFVRAIGTPKGDTIVAGAIALASSLGARVVAEGVETRAQAQFLLEQGCPTMQGYLFSKALPPEEFLAYMGRAGARAAP